MILRADMSGSLVAVSEFISTLSQEKVTIHVMSQAVGNVTQQDIELARQSGRFIDSC
jgi:translation initiation factor IF-2